MRRLRCARGARETAVGRSLAQKEAMGRAFPLTFDDQTAGAGLTEAARPRLANPSAP
jgi:hypothetical protein